MNLPDRHLLLGMTLGALCATALAAIGPGAVIQAFGEEKPVGIDTSKLVRFDDSLYVVTSEAGVDMTPVAHARIKKIEYGRASTVDVVTTATGTYSTDALFSNHVQYPGITAEQVRPYWPRNRFSFWNGHGGWTSFSSSRGNSFISLHNDNIGIHTRGNRTCIHTANFSTC